MTFRPKSGNDQANIKKHKSVGMKFNFKIRQSNGINQHRLPSLSQCLGNQILPKNSMLINHIFSVACNNAGQAIDKIIGEHIKERMQSKQSKTCKN